MIAGALAPAVLEQIPIFRGLTADEAGQLASAADLRQFAPSEIVLKQGALGQRLWILISGGCEVYTESTGASARPEHIVLATLEPYSNFGEMSFFHEAPHSASVRAKTAVQLLCLERAKFDASIGPHCAAACKLAVNTVASLAERLRRMDGWVADLVSHQAVQERIPEWAQLRAKLFDSWTL